MMLINLVTSSCLSLYSVNKVNNQYEDEYLGQHKHHIKPLIKTQLVSKLADII